MVKEVSFGNQKVYKAVSPQGKHFESIRKALNYMVKENYPKEDLAQIRDGLKLQGWLTHTNLPKDWLYKVSGMATPFITDLGFYFKLRSHALEYLRRENRLEDFNMLQKFVIKPWEFRKKQDQETPSLDETWIQCPKDWLEVEGLAGWQYIETPLGKSKHFNTYLSPDGIKLKGKRLTYKHMQENNYPKEKCDFMLQGLLKEGWNFSEKLPEKWLYKFKKSSVDEGGVKRRGHLHLISPTGDLFKNKALAMKHLKNSYKTEDLNILSKFSIFS